MENIDVSVVITVALIGGVISSLIASNKGRSAGGFFLLGALFPLIGVIAALVAKSATQQAIERQIAAGQYPQQIATGAPPPPPPPPPPGQAQAPPPPGQSQAPPPPVTPQPATAAARIGMVEHTTCPACGMALKPSNVKCPQCGSSRYTCGSCGSAVSRTASRCKACLSNL